LSAPLRGEAGFAKKINQHGLLHFSDLMVFSPWEPISTERIPRPDKSTQLSRFVKENSWDDQQAIMDGLVYPECCGCGRSLSDLFLSLLLLPPFSQIVHDVGVS